MNFAIDLTPLIQDLDILPYVFVQEFIARFAQDVAGRLARLR